ncbi:(d)CMP kinase [Arachidicoccus sp.]|uniref:(d)CMP kinase n=1 Tax=Arachidicoccus sp. TaxID=1872624 RepID=UPI003D213A16
MKKIIIAIDGFSSCGKSTMAKQLAKELGYVFIDSGAMYRAITLYFVENNIDLANDAAIASAIEKINLKFVFNNEAGKSDIYLNGENIEQAIRSMSISNSVSEVAALEKVRTFAVAAQQKMGVEKGIIMDGRDVGTNVFPNAELKIFMTASVDVRTKRRYDELVVKNPELTLEEVKENLEKRDLIDTTRKLNPLRKADDARVLDNSNLTMEEQLAIAKQWADEVLEVPAR